MSLDPIGFSAGDGNLYRYTHDQPTLRTDYSGLWDGLDPGSKPTTPGVVPGNPNGTHSKSAPHTLITITDKTTPGDYEAWLWHRYHWLYGAPVIHSIGSPQAWADVIGQYQDHSIGYLVLSGHGLLNEAGTSATMGSIYHKNITDQQASVIRSKLAPGAELVIASCQSGLNSSSMQKLANKLGCTVWGTTGMSTTGENQDGQWVKVEPQNPNHSRGNPAGSDVGSGVGSGKKP